MNFYGMYLTITDEEREQALKDNTVRLLKTRIKSLED